MTKATIRKNIKLSSEFDKYVSTSPTAYKNIPSGAHVVITTAADKALSAANISIACNSNSRNIVEAHKANGRWTIKTFEK